MAGKVTHKIVSSPIRLTFALVLLVAAHPGRLFSQQGADDGEWRFYRGDSGGTRYAPLSEIDRANVIDLEIALGAPDIEFRP